MYEELIQRLRANNRKSGWSDIDRLMDEAAEGSGKPGRAIGRAGQSGRDGAEGQNPKILLQLPI